MAHGQTAQVGGDDTRTTDASVQRISDDQAKMAADIAEIKALLETTPFAKKICETIGESGSLTKCIKSIVWQTIREKAWALVIAAVIIFCGIFAKEIITYLATSSATQVIQQINHQNTSLNGTSQSSQ